MTARVRYWLWCHPRVGRPARILGWLQLLAITAVCTAPAASASTNAALLNWTGLRDTTGVPIGDYYLSLASISDQLTRTGPDAAVWDPSSWAPWMMHGLYVMFTNITAANVLTGEVGIFVAVIAVSLWVLRLTVSTYWLTLIGEIARAITEAVITVTTRAGLVALTVPVGVFCGVLAVRRGEAGRGATMILVALLIPGLALTIFADPAAMMYGPDGLLAFARRMAFSTAQAATNNGAIGGGGLDGQVDTLTASLITHVIREPLQVFNFGHVVDHVGGCGAQYSRALLQGESDGPVRAMARCGDVEAAFYAQHLDATNIVGGLALIIAAVLFGWFMISAGASVFMVSLKAMYTTAKLLPSVFAGAIAGAAQQHATSTVWKFFKHPLEAMVFITFVSVIGLAIERLVSNPLPAALGGASPVAHLIVMAGASMAALYLLRHIRADLGGGHHGPGLLSRASDVALGLGLHAALGGAATAVLGGARGLRGGLRASAPKTPWEQLDEHAAKPRDVLGPPQEGFAPIPGAPDIPTDAPDTTTAPWAPERGGAGSGNVAPAGLSPVAGAAGDTQVSGRSAAPATVPAESSRTARHLKGDPGWEPHGPAATMNPLDGSDPAWMDGSPSLAEYLAHDAEVPLPGAPRTHEDDWRAEPPGQDPDVATTTVDPITDR